jgi:hypothetical protein
MEEEKPVPANKPSNSSSKPIFNEDFITRLTNNLAKQNNQNSEGSSITHLEKIFNYGTMNEIIAGFTEDDKKALLEFLPE